MNNAFGYTHLTSTMARPLYMVNKRNSVEAKPVIVASNKSAAATKFNFSSTPTDDGPGKMNNNELIEYVEGKVFEVLKSAAKCKHEKLARTATFEDLGFDSLDGVELVLAMEEYFGFEITNPEAEKITSVMDAITIFHENVLKRQSVTQTDAVNTDATD